MQAEPGNLPSRRGDFPGFVWLWNLSQGLATPQVHLRMARALEAASHAPERAMLMMAFRGSGKSTITGLFCAWALAVNPDLRILAMAADIALARKMVRMVRKVIEAHPVTAALGLRPPRLEDWGTDSFTIARPSTLRDPSMLARSVGSNVTGARADIIICDDVEVPRTADTGEKRIGLRTSLAELDYIQTPGALRLWLGTPHCRDSIYARKGPAGEAGFLGDIARVEIPLLDEAGRSAWPARFSASRIERLRKAPGFAAQMQLQPVTEGAGRLNPDRVIVHDQPLEFSEAQGRTILRIGGVQMVSASCWWDPAFGSAEREGSAAGRDKSVVAAVYQDLEGGFWLQDIAFLERPEGEALDEATWACREVARFLRRGSLAAVHIEVNGIGRFLPGLMRRVLRERRQTAAVIEKVSTARKSARILDAFVPLLAAEKLRVSAKVAGTAFMSQLADWRPDQPDRGHDDALDAVAGAILAEPVRIGARVSPGGPSGRPVPAQRPDWRPGSRLFQMEQDE